MAARRGGHLGYAAISQTRMARRYALHGLQNCGRLPTEPAKPGARGTRAVRQALAHDSAEEIPRPANIAPARNLTIEQSEKEPRPMSIISRYRDQRALRRPSELEFVIADGIDYLNPAHWDAVCAHAGFFFERTYLRVLETAGPENLTPRYALIYRDGVPQAAVLMQLVRVEAARLRRVQLTPKEKAEQKAAEKTARKAAKKAAAEMPAQKGAGKDGEKPAGKAPTKTTSRPASRNPAKRLIRHFSSPAKDKLAERVHQRVLVCGNLLSYGFHAAAFAPGVAPENVWPGIHEVLYRVRQAEKLSGNTNFVLIKDLTAPELKSSRVLEHYGFAAVETEPNMVLAVDAKWQDYAGYLGSLASKYRSAVKNQVLKPIEDAGCTVELITDIAAHSARLHALYLEVHHNADLRPVTLPETYWAALQAAGGERLRVVALMRNGEKEGGEMLGFIACLKDGDLGVAYHIGFDRKASAGLPVYLRLLHAAVEHLIAMGARRISLGRTALEPKARLGARPQPMWVWMRHRQPLINSVTRRLLGAVQHDEAPETDPFKKEKAAA
jgi:hypothetical protein